MNTPYRFLSMLIFVFFTASNAQTKQTYWIDIRVPGEYLFGGKREIFLKPKVPTECTAVLTVVEKFNPATRKIDPLVATEYYSFAVKGGFWVCIPKHPDVYVRPDIESLGTRFQNFSLETEFKFLLSLLRTILEDERSAISPATDFRVFASDFCTRLSLVYPRHNALPCCDGKASFEGFMNGELTTMIPIRPVAQEGRRVFFRLKPITK